jgi:hypothetical protein
MPPGMSSSKKKCDVKLYWYCVADGILFLLSNGVVSELGSVMCMNKCHVVPSRLNLFRIVYNLSCILHYVLFCALFITRDLTTEKNN